MDCEEWRKAWEMVEKVNRKTQKGWLCTRTKATPPQCLGARLEIGHKKDGEKRFNFDSLVSTWERAVSRGDAKSTVSNLKGKTL